MQCMQPNFLLTGQVYTMLMSCVPQAWAYSTEKVPSTLFKLIVKFFLKGVVFVFLHCIVYIELLYCVTNFELVWTWNKVAVVENAKKLTVPTFPEIHFMCEHVVALENIVYLSIWLAVRKLLCYSYHIFYGPSKHNPFRGHRVYLCRFQVVIFQAMQVFLSSICYGMMENSMKTTFLHS